MANEQTATAPDLFSGSHQHPYLTAAMDNVLAWRLGEICSRAAAASAGDYIDRGLILRQFLEDRGFRISQGPVK